MRLAAVPSCVGNKDWKKIDNKSVPVFRSGISGFFYSLNAASRGEKTKAKRRLLCPSSWHC